MHAHRHKRGRRKTVASGADIAPRHAALLLQSEARRCKRCLHSRFFEVPKQDLPIDASYWQGEISNDELVALK